MALTNSQYSKIMRSYEEKQNASRLLQDSRTSEIFRKVPEYKRLEDEAVDASMEYARAVLLGTGSESDGAMDKLRARIDKITEDKGRLLIKNGYPADYLKPVYVCPDCKDTGYIGTQKCHCFKQAIVDLLYSQSNIKEAVQNDNLENFSLEWYSKTDIDPVSNKSAYDLMSANYRAAENFVKNFPSDQEQNLLLYGEVGLGKTFLSRCIANELLKTGHTVLYLSAPQLFDVFGEALRKHYFEGEPSELKNYILNCDLLIVDDLGSEMTNEFTISNLNICINERHLGNHSTILSSNLTPNQIKETYGERNFSRIAGTYQPLRFYGRDIRMRKR